MRKFVSFLLWTVAILLAPAVAFAADEAAAVDYTYALGAGIAVGLAGLGCGLGQGLAAGNTTAGIARNPGAAGSMFLYFILAMAFIESIAIYGLVVGILVIP